MAEDLTARTCIPCKGGVPPLTRDEAETYRRETPKWDLIDDATRIRRSLSFPNFAAALDFVNQVGALAEREDHHPDITFGWGYADVCLQTHKIKGLHENDFILAAKIDRLAGFR
jgi:4a-hydroxytetrahydrobiopterin dehydratase